MDPLLIIAITSGIPEGGLRALAETLPKGSKALQALACRPDLTEPVAEILHKRVTGKARAATVRHITNPERLRELFTKGDLRPAVCANPHTPVDILEGAMLLASQTWSATALRAACNPSTPLETRKAELQRGNTAELLVAVSSPLAMSVVRAYALVENNQWMLETNERYGKNIQRALVSRPVPAQDLYDSFRRDLLAYVRVPGLRNHPLRTGVVSALSVDDLLVLENVAADLELLARPEFTLELAAKVLEQPGVGPEPQIISACLQRFGIDALISTRQMPRWAETRLDAASWLEPMAEYVKHLASPGWDENKNARTLAWQLEARQQVPALFINMNDPVELRETLQTIYALVKDWESDLGGLLTASKAL